MYWIGITILLCCALLASWAGCAHALSGTEITFLRIGKADAIIITTSEHTVLIDAGEDDDDREILAFLESRRVDVIDVMIITHYDKDHVGGAAGVLDGIRVGAVYDANYESDSKPYDGYVKAMKANGVPRFRVTQQLSFDLGSLHITLMPTALETEEDNDNSLVVAMTDGHHSFLFAADAEEARLDELMRGGIGQFDLLKMPHHGRGKDNLEAFVQRVAPKIAIITDSDKNPADAPVLRLLEAMDIDVYETRDGDITAVSGEQRISVIQ